MIDRESLGEMLAGKEKKQNKTKTKGVDKPYKAVSLGYMVRSIQ